MSIIALLRFCLSHYQSFNYYMDALKSMYFERRDAVGDNKFETDWRPLLDKIFKSREPFR